jgi:hypothetical protein
VVQALAHGGWKSRSSSIGQPHAPAALSRMGSVFIAQSPDGASPKTSLQLRSPTDGGVGGGRRSAREQGRIVAARASSESSVVSLGVRAHLRSFFVYISSSRMENLLSSLEKACAVAARWPGARQGG